MQAHDRRPPRADPPVRENAGVLEALPVTIDGRRILPALHGDNNDALHDDDAPGEAFPGGRARSRHGGDGQRAGAGLPSGSDDTLVDGRLDLRRGRSGHRKGAGVRVDFGGRRPLSRSAGTIGYSGSHTRHGRDGPALERRGRRRRPREPPGARRRARSGVAALARRARPGGSHGGLRLRRRSLCPGSRGVPLRAPDGDRRERAAAAPVSRRDARRVRARQRPVGRRGLDEKGDPPHLRWQRDDPERDAFLGLLGRGLRPRRHGLLVVARFAIDRLPAHRRRPRGRDDVHRLRAGSAAPDPAALSAHGPPQPGRPPGRRARIGRRRRLDGPAEPFLRVHRRRRLAARLQVRRGSDVEPSPDQARRLAVRSVHVAGETLSLRHGPGTRLSEGDRLRRRREDLDRLLRVGRAHAPLPLRRGRLPAKRDHAGPMVGPRGPVLRRRAQFGVGRRRRRLRLLHGHREVAAREPSLPRPPGRHRHGAPDPGRRNAPDYAFARPPLLRGYLLDRRRAALSLAPRSLRKKGRDALREQGRRTRPARADPPGVLDDSGAGRLSPAGQRPQATGLRPGEEIPRARPRVRRPRLADRAGSVGPGRALRSSARFARVRRRFLRPEERHGPQQGARGHRRGRR